MLFFFVWFIRAWMFGSAHACCISCHRASSLQQRCWWVLQAPVPRSLSLTAHAFGTTVFRGGRLIQPSSKQDGPSAITSRCEWQPAKPLLAELGRDACGVAR
ncbi:unnamed protein product [Prorocentrum cordatum]|uniref:Secreted protein n=1 Tax=Prorocentrum cordatum TaxID=2364126 RepID=A0ABN9WDJ6_9DINO|nr:unnamed protein product [Polarella glacialis]|mmetsp:Transcript_34042/g.91247  ORF Transcript_34042/g.91247 Transcript_34042/m.91247 type:complete len:102 (+) Transcript_34042:165-470(+)